MLKCRCRNACVLDAHEHYNGIGYTECHKARLVVMISWLTQLHALLSSHVWSAFTVRPVF